MENQIDLFRCMNMRQQNEFIIHQKQNLKV